MEIVFSEALPERRLRKPCWKTVKISSVPMYRSMEPSTTDTIHRSIRKTILPHRSVWYLPEPKKSRHTTVLCGFSTRSSQSWSLPWSSVLLSYRSAQPLLRVHFAEVFRVFRKYLPVICTQQLTARLWSDPMRLVISPAQLKIYRRSF